MLSSERAQEIQNLIQYFWSNPQSLVLFQYLFGNLKEYTLLRFLSILQGCVWRYEMQSVSYFIWNWVSDHLMLFLECPRNMSLWTVYSSRNVYVPDYIRLKVVNSKSRPVTSVQWNNHKDSVCIARNYYCDPKDLISPSLTLITSHSWNIHSLTRNIYESTAAVINGFICKKEEKACIEIQVAQINYIQNNTKMSYTTSHQRTVKSIGIICEQTESSFLAVNSIKEMSGMFSK